MIAAFSKWFAHGQPLISEQAQQAHVMLARVVTIHETGFLNLGHVPTVKGLGHGFFVTNVYTDFLLMALFCSHVLCQGLAEAYIWGYSC